MTTHETSSVSIIGAGQMGAGIAQVCIQAGMSVNLSDASHDALGEAVSKIEDRLSRLASKGVLDNPSQKKLMHQLLPTHELSQLGNVDMVIEAASEKEGIKHKIFENLLPHLADHTILASNTSSISITRLAARTDRPERFMGVHFMNPVPVMTLVELIRGIATSTETFERSRTFVEKLDKVHTVSEDFPAFIVNRILIPMINEAAYVLYEGVGDVKSIDGSMRLGANHPMGPLELADFIGLDTCVAIMKVLYEGLADTKYRPCPLLIKYVEAGWVGRKSGRGFYDYRGEQPIPTR